MQADFTCRIPFFDYPAVYNSSRREVLAILDEVMSRGAFILQEEVERLEKDIAERLGVREVIAVADGTNALLLSFWALGIGSGDEVIVPSLSHVATVAAIKFSGATPVLADVDVHGLLDAQTAAAQVGPRTRAIVPVHLNGRVCEMDGLLKLAEVHGLATVEDAAQAFGATLDGKAAGSFGTLGTLSFYPAKALGCFGDGGAVMTNDVALAQRLRLLRNHGRDSTGKVVAWGLNSRLDNIQAAVLHHKLGSYSAAVARRREIAQLYQKSLANVGDLVLPPPPEQGPHFDIFQNYEVLTGRREELRAWLSAAGVGTMIQPEGAPVHRVRALGFADTLSATDRYFEQCLKLPLYPSLTDAQAGEVVKAVVQFFGDGECPEWVETGR